MEGITFSSVLHYLECSQILWAISKVLPLRSFLLFCKIKIKVTREIVIPHIQHLYVYFEQTLHIPILKVLNVRNE